jgi:hypothetical protein
VIGGNAVMTERIVYRSWMSDNRRWDALELREGDIVISAPSKCGVTWTQRLVALLVFDGPEMPGPMATVSPWIDTCIRPVEEVVGILDAQRHRRFIKTHTPLDGLVLDDRVTYIGVGRDPRDAAMSELSAWDNLDLNRMRALQRSGGGAGPEPVDDGVEDVRTPLEAFRDWMEGPIMSPEGPGMHPPGPGMPPPPGMPGMPPPGMPGMPPPHPGFRPASAGMGFHPREGVMPKPPTKHMGSLANILHHFGTVWERRELPNVAMFHYADYRQDLAGELIRLAALLGIDLSPDRAEELSRYASLSAMRARASEFAPDSTAGIWRSDERFFRAGGRGEWREFFSADVAHRYHDRAAQLAPPELLAWAHDGRSGHDPA